MIARIRELMSTPFARPPGRRSVWRQLWPAWCVVAVYGILLTLLLASGAMVKALSLGYYLRIHWQPRLFMANAVTYSVAGSILLVLPIIQASLTWASERDRGTSEALIMTHQDHRAVALGRFLWLLAPWCRVLIWLLPLYAILALGGLARQSAEHVDVANAAANAAGLAFAPKGLISLAECVICFDRSSYVESSGPWPFAVPLFLVRVLNDFSILVFVMAAAYYISARARTAGAALATGLLVVPLVLATVLSLDIWWVALTAAASELRKGGDYYAVVSAVYCATAVLLMVARFFLAWLLVRKVARNFDAYLLREKS